MEYTVPTYYKEFSCIAGECEDSCCAGWSIVIDDVSLKKYMRYKGGFGNRLRNSIDLKEKTFHQYERRCAFLNEDNLCDIYSEAGKEYLCKTCKRYPRHIEEYENLREMSLSLSCPEAARIILSQDKPLELRTFSTDGEETYEEFDYFLFSALMDVREVVFDLLQNREIPFRVRLAMVLALCHDVQRRIQSQELFSIQEVLDRYQENGAIGRFENKIPEKKSSEQIEVTFQKLYQLEHLREEWLPYLDEVQKHLSENSTALIDETILEKIAVYFIYTYFVGAVYDGKPYSKMKLAIYSVVMIREMLGVRLDQNGVLTFADYVEISYRYAREVEHSDENLKTLEYLFSKDKDLTLEKMLLIV